MSKAKKKDNAPPPPPSDWNAINFFSESPEFYQGKIPYIVIDLIEELKRRQCEKVEGIFRLAASETKCSSFVRTLEKGFVEHWSEVDDIHIVATALKRYFRKMAIVNPLLPFEAFDQAIATTESEKFAEEMKIIISKIYIGRQRIFKYLLGFLFFITENSSVNKMVAGNLAICFAPNLIVPRKNEDRMNMKIAGNCNTLLEKMILNYKVIFENVEEVLCTKTDILSLSEPPISWEHVTHLIARAKSRQKNSIIQYIPLFSINPDRKIIRPTRDPPEAPDESTLNQPLDLF